MSLYKARLIGKNFHQQAGFDLSESFSPVVKPTAIRVVFTLALAKLWSLLQLDINNAFLTGILKENIYMEQPFAFQQPKENPPLVCKLHKAIYGLKQARFER